MKTLAKALAVAWVMVGVGGAPVQAQDGAHATGADSTVAELWQNMHEAGMISDEEYQHALQYGTLPVRINVEPPEAVEAAAEAARQAQEEAWAANREKHQYWHHQGLALENGQIQSFPALKEKKRADLRARAAEVGARQRLEKREAEEWAQWNNIAIRVCLPDGGATELMSIRGGVPRFYITCNEDAADTVSTDELWPGGTTGLGLTGAGTTMGIWDGGDVLTTHQEFDSGPGTRVTDRDGTSESGISGHATHVAGTLIAEGLYPAARGMSYEANLDAYDWKYDIAEMGDAAADDELSISNHSYGYQVGWGVLPIEVGGVVYYFLAWYGNTTLSQVQSYWFGFYDEVSRDIDATVYDATFYLPVWAAGNERGADGQAPANQPVGHYAWNGTQWVQVYDQVRPNDGDAGGFDTLPPQEVAKNILTVGSAADIGGGYEVPADVVITYLSSFGPTDDGRIKPDLVGNGEQVFSTVSSADDDYGYGTGTSMAAPNVAGSLNLLLERHSQLMGTENPMWASTLKAIAVHTADEAGSFAGPDYRHGWGLLNARKAVQLINADFDSESLAHIKEVVLMDGEFIEFPVVSNGSQPLRVTICWTDPAGDPPTPAVDPPDPMLVNDLDLRIVRGATTYRPWILNPGNRNAAATTGDNFRDNVEQVHIANPTAGEYLVRVTHKNSLVDDTGAVSLQNVSIAISGNVPQPAPTLEIVSLDMTGPEEITLAFAAVVGRTYQVQYTADMGNVNWVNTGPEISATRDLVAAAVSAPSPEQKRFYRVMLLE
ncbi:MAG: S8 family serine peptidase [bacterium]|nr:S8 family serine peptidase [bacterium]